MPMLLRVLAVLWIAPIAFGAGAGAPDRPLHTAAPATDAQSSAGHARFLPNPVTTATTSIGVFTGGDPGEGLDLQGTFPYAVNVRGPAAGAVGDATFTDDSAAGVTITAQNEILNWSAPSYGATANDDNLEVVMQSIRWSANPNTVNISLANLVAGDVYQLQLLFTEACCDRGFDVFVDGALVADEFSPFDYVGDDPTPTAGVVLTYSFTAPDTTLDIVLSGVAASFGDRNPTISGLTLEDLNDTAPVLSGVAIDASVTEGGTATLTGNMTDADGDAFELTVDWGDGTVETFNYAAGTPSFSETHVYADDDPSGTPSDIYTVELTLSDGVGSNSETVNITVVNAAPQLSNLVLTGPDGVGGTATLTGDLSDAGVDDTFTLTIDWGDATPPEVIALPAGTTSFDVDHTYNASGAFVVTVAVVDDDGGADTAVVEAAVVADVPVLGPAAMFALALLLAGVALLVVRR